MDFASNTRNTHRLGVLGLATLLALLSGCFTEPAGGDTGATGGGCDEGSFGCACLDGICDVNLVCNASDLCVPAEDCTPGTMNCGCDELGRCGPGLECTTNGCFPPGGTTVTPTGSESNTSTDTSTTGTSTTSTTMPTTTMPSTTSTETETNTTNPDTDSTSTGDPLSCVEQAEGDGPEEICSDCFVCTNTDECAADFEVCDSITGCPAAVQCLQLCAVSGKCFTDCCADQDPTFESAALAVHNCREDTCSQGACGSFAPISGSCGT